MRLRRILTFTFVAIIVAGAAALTVAPNVGVEHATPAEERAVLRKLRQADARQTLDALFWAVNHHSIPVKRACLSDRLPPTMFDNVRRWEVISIKRSSRGDADYADFLVRFQFSMRYLKDDPTGDADCPLEWRFIVSRKGASSTWKVCAWGMG